MAAVMVFGNAGAVLADDAGTQGETYYFQKVYQLTGGNTDTAKSPAEEFTFESKDAKHRQEKQICMRFPEPAIMTPTHQIESQNWKVFR